MGDVHQYVGSRLRLYRIKSDFTQQNLADVLKCNRSTYAYYESGRTMPDIPTLARVAKIYGVSLGEFLPLEGQELIAADLSAETEKQRPKKSVDAVPDRVGGLTADEKRLIALLRAEECLSANEVYEVLMEKLGK